MHVWGQPPLQLDGREVLQVVAEEAAQVLDEPVEQRREVQRVAGRPLCSRAVRVGGGAVARGPARSSGQVSVTNRDSQELLAVRGGVGLADRAGRDLPARQGRGVLAAPGGAVPTGPAGAGESTVAAHTRRR